MDLRIEYACPNSLRRAETNARVHDRKQKRALMAGMKRYGFLVPALVDGDLNIVAGHGRVEAAQELGLKQIPIIRIEHLDENEIRAFRIADNKLAEMSHWDRDKLASEIKFLVGCNIDLETTIAFTPPEVDLVLEQAQEKRGPDLAQEDALPQMQAAVSAPGDAWSLGEHKILAGDLLHEAAVRALMGAELARMVITDPPYNLPVAGFISGKGAARHDEFAMGSGEMSKAEFTALLVRALNILSEACEDGAVLFAFMDWRHLAELYDAGDRASLQLLNLIAWVKTNAGMGTFYRSQHELVAVLKKGEAPHINNFELGQNGRHRTNVWTYRGANAFGPTRKEDLASHPTVKPVAMIADAIKDVSKRGDVVLDGFGGSGTTLIAAEMTGRRARLIELEPQYVDLTVRRWQKLTGKSAVHAATGATFEECEERAYARPGAAR